MDANDTPDDLRVTVASTPAGCSEVTRLVAQRLTAWAVGDRPRYIVELVLEEILTNITRHAYANTVAGQIDVHLQRRPETIVLAFEDSGPAFDPTRRDASPAGGALETATIGGRGILMVRNLTQSMRYERCNGQNRLELVIGLEPPPEVPAR
jgi:anti-sigma regulatory factor (Ser/Thr protein kinase)